MPELVHAAPDTMQVKLERALAAVLRRMGLIGKVAPGAEQLCRIARDYVEYRNTLATDQGEVVSVGGSLAPPNPLLDDSIPF